MVDANYKGKLMLLFCSAELLLRAIDGATDLTDPAVVRAVTGLRRALALTEADIVAQAHATPGTRPASVLGPSDIASARAYVSEGIAHGVDCPVCRQSCKLYARKLYAEMAVWLIVLVKRWNVSGDWINVQDFPLRGGDYGKLVHWGLAERAPNDNPAKRTSGMWRPTLAGVQFAMGRTKVPSHVYLYNNEVHRFGDEKVGIAEVLGTGFNYSELMASF